jgi:hypothetical protein
MCFATPAAVAEDAYIDGVGAMQCSDITATMKTDKAKSLANQLVGWAYGYMTRRNIERAVNNKRQVNLQQQDFAVKMLGTMVTVCEKGPDIYYYQAVDAFYEVLMQDQGLTS